jgi:hypothetical protein
MTPKIQLSGALITPINGPVCVSVLQDYGGGLIFSKKLNVLSRNDLRIMKGEKMKNGCLINKTLIGMILIIIALSDISLFARNSSSTENEGQSQAFPIIANYWDILDFEGKNEKGWNYRLRTAPFRKLNRLYIAFAWIKEGELVYFNEQYDPSLIGQLVNRCRKVNPQATILISSGYDETGSMYTGAAKDPQKFALSVVKFIEQNNLDGYDMDWENGIDPDAMVELLKAVHDAFLNKGFILTLAVWPSPTIYEHTVPLIAEYVDQINIMSYGIDESLEEDANKYYSAGFPYSKMIGGIETEIDYPMGYAPDTVDTLNGTIKDKCDFALKNGLAGMMAWRLDNDYRPVKKHKAYGYPSYKGALNMYIHMSGRRDSSEFSLDHLQGLFDWIGAQTEIDLR